MTGEEPYFKVTLTPNNKESKSTLRPKMDLWPLKVHKLWLLKYVFHLAKILPKNTLIIKFLDMPMKTLG